MIVLPRRFVIHMKKSRHHINFKLVSLRSTECLLIQGGYVGPLFSQQVCFSHLCYQEKCLKIDSRLCRINIYFVQFACLKYLNILVKQAENSWHWCIYVHIHVAWMLTPMKSLNCSIPNRSWTYFQYLHLIASISIKGSLARIRLISFNFDKISWRNIFSHSGIVCTMPRSLLLFSEKKYQIIKKKQDAEKNKFNSADYSYD